MLLTSALILSGCGDSIKSVEPPKLEPAPEELAKDCPRPTKLPDKDLTKGEVVSNWAEDRGRLVTCADSKKAVVDYYQTRDAKITGE